jgi:hypothetical protein
MSSLRPREGAIRRESRAAESTRETLEAVREKVRRERFNEKSNAARKMVHNHYNAQMKNIRNREANNQSFRNLYGEDPQAGNNTTYSNHVILNHSHGPTNFSTQVNHSQNTQYATVMLGGPHNVNYEPKGVRGDREERGAVRYKPKPVGGARKKTRKHKKESRTKSKSRKLRKSRK